jgi:hypothetical protein
MVNIKKRYNFPIIVTEQGLRRLYDEITQKFENGKISITIGYNDKSSVTDATIEDVINDENKKGRKINVLRIKDKIVDGSFIDLSFGSIKIVHSSNGEREDYITDISLEISSPERQSAFIIQSLIEDRLNSSFKASYIKPFNICMIFTFVYTLLVTLVLDTNNSISKFFQPDLKGGWDLIQLLSFIGIILIAGLAYIVFYTLFPKLTFVIGEQIEKYNLLAKRKSNIFWVVVVGSILMLAGVLIGVLLSK